jgi:flagellar protein FliS
MESFQNSAGYNEAVKRYASVNSIVSKTKQVVLLYEAAIKHMVVGREAIVSKDIQSRYNSMTQAAIIIQGLQSALDFENGGDIAPLMDNFYFSIYMRIMNIQLNDDLNLCDSVIKELGVMKKAWEEVDQVASVVDSSQDTSSGNSTTDISL